MLKNPLRYAGGKSKAIKVLASFLPKNINQKKIISPFFGGGSFEFYLNSLGCIIEGYDIFDILVNYWQIQLTKPIELARMLMEYEPSKNFYNERKSILKSHFIGEKIIEDPVKLAAEYFFSHNLSYGPMFLGWWSSNYDNRKKFYAMIDRVKIFSPKNVTISCKNFTESLKNTEDNFLYLDPPYFLNCDKMEIGLYPNRNFPIHHKGFKHFELSEMIKSHKGCFMLSYNDCDEVKKLYDGYNFHYPKWHYSMGNGELRIGKYRKKGNRNNVKENHEILITNY